ncbi:response regulator [Rhodoblastus acidophilus]|nr:response regulator [Rhodoblastus acidophilus]PPQ37400.1 response regulator [Rhodoblastus acidophilus]RAI23186.1 response regulator [Rhodoblastus acidophilus]
MTEKAKCHSSRRAPEPFQRRTPAPGRARRPRGKAWNDSPDIMPRPTVDHLFALRIDHAGPPGHADHEHGRRAASKVRAKISQLLPAGPVQQVRNDARIRLSPQSGHFKPTFTGLKDPLSLEGHELPMLTIAENRRSRHVLIVEDDRDDAYLLKRALTTAARERQVDLEIAHSENGMDALGEVAFNDLLNRLPDIIVVDLNMPVVNGERFLNVLRSDLRLTNVPTVVLTTATENYVLDSAMSEGADAAFSKPNTNEELLAIARVILSYGEPPAPVARHA